MFSFDFDFLLEDSFSSNKQCLVTTTGEPLEKGHTTATLKMI